MTYGARPPAASEDAAAPSGDFTEILRAIITGSGDAIFAKDLSGYYLFVNDAAARVFGVAPADVVGRSDAALHGPQAAARLALQDQEVVSRGEPVTFEHQVATHSGALTFLTTKSPYRDGTGRIVGIIGIAKDITARRAAEETRIADARRMSGIIRLQQAVITAPRSLTLVMPEIAQRIEGLVGASGCAIGVRTKDQRITLQAAIGCFAPRVDLRHPLAVVQNGMVAREDRLLAPLEQQTGSPFEAWMTSCAELRSVAGIPLRDGPLVNGILVIGSQHTNAFSEPDLQALQLVGGLLSAALSRAAAFEDNRRLLEERSIALAARAESEERFRAMADSAPVMIWTTNQDGVLEYVNPARLSLSRRTLEQELAEGWGDLLHPDDRGGVPGDLPTTWPRHREYRIRREDGGYAWILETEAARLRPDGTFAGCVTIAHDITQRRRVEEALRASEDALRDSIDAGHLGLWEWNLKTGRFRGSGHCAAILGCTPADLGDTFDAFVQSVLPEEEPEFRAALERAMMERTPFDHEYRIRQPDGSIRWVASRGRFSYDERNTPIRLRGAILDISDRKLLEQQLVQAQKIEAIGQLAAGIAHEINTPTQYVSDNLSFLLEALTGLESVYTALEGLRTAVRGAGGASESLAALDEALAAADMDYLRLEMPKAARQAVEGVRRVTEIVRAMKDFSHPGQTERMHVDINTALQNTCTVSRNEWKYVAELKTDLAEEMPLLPCHPGELQQVFLNLIINAAHAIEEVVSKQPGTKGVITIATRVLKDCVEIRIGDTGPGIPEALALRVFEPFFTTKVVGKGTGQGLSLCRDIVVKRHNGTLTFETTPGAGTTFIVRLPLQPDALLVP